jgi:hypothetical protein
MAEKPVLFGGEISCQIRVSNYVCCARAGFFAFAPKPDYGGQLRLFCLGGAFAPPPAPGRLAESFADRKKNKSCPGGGRPG